MHWTSPRWGLTGRRTGLTVRERLPTLRRPLLPAEVGLLKEFVMRLAFQALGLGLLSTLLSACSVDHTGLLPVEPGVSYRLQCVFVQTFTGIDGEVRSRPESNERYCFNGMASDADAYNTCVRQAQLLELQQREDNPQWPDLSVRVAESAIRRLPGEECSILPGTPEGVGRRIDGLSASGMVLRRDETGHSLGDSSLANLQANVSRAQLRVSAKFAQWRHANTGGKGRAFLDTSWCPRMEGCPLVLRHFGLALNDFTIVRPTVLAKDIKVRNARLYTISNYETTTDASGAFVFRKVKAVVSAEVNGERMDFMSETPTVVRGRLDRFRGGRGVAPQRVWLSIDESTPKFAVRGTVLMEVVKHEAALRNNSTGKCLAGSLNDAVVSAAVIENCGSGARGKAWRFERRGSAFRIQQAFSNACLNLKTAVDNREGGAVHLVGCSPHRDQLWRMGGDGHIQHVASGKCLNVHAGRENRDGGAVSVYSCANTRDQSWAFIGTHR